MQALKARLTAMIGQLFSQSKLAEANNYALNHWDGLTLFLSDGRVEVDSNTVERSMRPTVVSHNAPRPISLKLKGLLRGIRCYRS
jgi:hypothetical protein